MNAIIKLLMTLYLSGIMSNKIKKMLYRFI